MARGDFPRRTRRPIGLLLLAFLLGACAAASAGTRAPASTTSQAGGGPMAGAVPACVGADPIASASRSRGADASGTVGGVDQVPVAVAGQKIAYAGDAFSPTAAGRGSFSAGRTLVKAAPVPGAAVVEAAEPCG